MVCVLAKFVTYTYVSSLCAVVAVGDVVVVVAAVGLCDVVVLVARVVLPAAVVAAAAAVVAFEAVVDFLCADEVVDVCSWWLRLLDLLDLWPAGVCSLCLERLE